ncbi:MULTISPECIES: alpha/beta hydrolase [Vibrio]|uniref:Alpha/beta hydrolase n=1 Tax=Vibrio mediterranei TaxID=689 RepID=A0A3G4VLF7_9VIBR|nr:MULTISPECIES: alpha/beta hydrolase [Vibrio]AYV23701.1 alpha/beta hydrolase [Vibrio mediterranei]USE02556.1 alpha/beta hydrolase [Vibrio sp. SCSIO 43133]
MKKKHLSLSVLLGLTTLSTLAFATTSNNIDAHKKFRGEQALEVDQSQWFRELRMENWTHVVPEQDIRDTLVKIDSGEPLRDFINTNEAGHWTYEFAQAADDYANSASDYESYRKASMMYLIASYPNHMTEHEHEAIERSVDMYLKAEALSPTIDVERVEMPLTTRGSITGLLHIPKGAEKPGVILYTGGVDKILTEHRDAIDTLLRQGFAVLTFDIPGGGLNNNIIIELGKEDQAHQAALAYVKSDSRLDSNNVGALSSSGGGVPLMTFILNTPQLKAGVARCAVVTDVLTDTQVFHHAPLMSSMSYGYRIGVKDVSDLNSYGQWTIPLALMTKGFKSNETDVPVLAINTKDDMVNPPEEMRYTAGLSTRGEVAYFGNSGHCPDGAEAELAITNFFLRYM